MIISLGEIIAFVSIALAVVGLGIKISANNAAQRKAFYKRLDDDRVSIENSFVKKSLCEMQHNHIKETLDEIKVFMKEISAVLDRVRSQLKK